MSAQDWVNLGIALFILCGIFAVMVWDRREWKKELRRGEEESE